MKTWIKINIVLKPSTEDHKEVARAIVSDFEHRYRIKHLYYARYTSLDEMRFEISALTKANRQDLKKYFLQYPCVLKAEIEDRGMGSLAHSYAYQAVKRINSFDKDIAADTDFLDVIHWMCNMRGLDYLREARLLSYRSLCINHQVAMESDENLKRLRQINMRPTVAHLAERLNLLGKGQSVKKAAPSDDRKRKPAVHAPAARGKAVGLSRAQSVGSGRR